MPTDSSRRGLRAPLVLALAAAGSACKSPADHYRDADREVYALIEERGAELLSGSLPFTVEPPTDSLRPRIERGEVDGLPPLRLTDCLEIALENSREYQTRKERLYLAALDLTLERWRFSVQENGELFTSVFGNAEGDASSANGIGSFGLSKLFGTGARILSDFGISVARNLASGDDWTVFTDLGLSITQPLLRGSGRLAVTEPLTQAERDLVYEVRAFERFRRTFAVDIANQVYRILQQDNVIQNEIANNESLSLQREKNDALAEAGRISEVDADQARQNELRSRDRLLSQRRRLADQVDGFKLVLGLPPEFELSIDVAELEELARIEDEDELPSLVLALDVALRERLDLLTTLERHEDRLRKILVAENALEAGLDLQLDIDVTSAADRPFDFDFSQGSSAFSVLLDLPLNLQPQRNTYRATYIAANAARREVEALGDGIVAEVRRSVRTLDQARASLDIQVGAVQLAERRVESARLQLDAGRVETRDFLEAQDALLEAQNAVTSARIDYRLAELDLFLAMEALRVGPKGLTIDDTVLVPSPAEGAGDEPEPEIEA